MPPRLFIIAGEASGDAHAAELIHHVKAIEPQASFFGIGGMKMQEAGATLVMDNHELAVVGLVEVLMHFSVIWKAYKTVKKILQTESIDLVILVDYPGFNLRIAKLAKRLGKKVMYFISPQLWAWKKGRIKTIRACVDTMAVIFPFEVEFYKKLGVDAIYVGNPLAEKVHAPLSRAACFEKFNLDPKKPVVALLPGSRKSELRYIFKTIVESAKLLKKQFPDVQFILPKASNLPRDLIEKPLSEAGLFVTIVESKDLYPLLSIANAAIVVSGTVTLEVALMQVPFIILYKLSYITFWLARLLVKVDTIGLCNIVAGKKIVPEFIQYMATPKAISEAIATLLTNEKKANEMRAALSSLKQSFLLPEPTPLGDVVLRAISSF